MTSPTQHPQRRPSLSMDTDLIYNNSLETTNYLTSNPHEEDHTSCPNSPLSDQITLSSNLPNHFFQKPLQTLKQNFLPLLIFFFIAQVIKLTFSFDIRVLLYTIICFIFLDFFRGLLNDIKIEIKVELQFERSR